MVKICKFIAKLLRKFTNFWILGLGVLVFCAWVAEFWHSKAIKICKNLAFLRQLAKKFQTNVAKHNNFAIIETKIYQNFKRFVSFVCVNF